MLPRPKSVLVISPTSTTNGATTTGRIDMLGYDFAVINVCTTTSNSTSNNVATLALAEGDTTSAFTNITAFVGDGAGGFTIPTAKTGVDSIIAQMRVDMRGRKRYLQLSVSPVTTQTIWANATLYRGDEAATVTANSGADVLVEG